MRRSKLIRLVVLLVIMFLVVDTLSNLGVFSEIYKGVENVSFTNNKSINYLILFLGAVILVSIIMFLIRGIQYFTEHYKILRADRLIGDMFVNILESEELNIQPMGPMGPMSPMEQANDSNFKPVASNVKFTDVIGADEAIRDLKGIVAAMKNPEIFNSKGANIPKGVLLYGPPGTGKTLIAKAIAGEAEVPFYSVSGSEFMEKYVGVGATRVRELYEEARKNAPCIVFIDEVDAIGGKRGQDTNSSEENRTINALLTELDGFNEADGVLTVVATNRKDSLDSALVRPGRIDRKIAVDLPDKEARVKLIELYSKNKPMHKDFSAERLAKSTTGFSGAGIEALLSEAARITALKEYEHLKDTNEKVDFNISNENLELAIFKTIMEGDIKDNQSLRDKKELELVAWHEAGHALLAKLLNGDEIDRVTILSSTSGAGGVTMYNPSKNTLQDKEYLRNRVKVMYGGRAAEEIFFGDADKVTTGASNDIEQATKLIMLYLGSFGMGKDYGLVNIDVLFKNKISDEFTNQAVQLSKDLYFDALTTLKRNKVALKKIALELLDKESLYDEDIDNIINEFAIDKPQKENNILNSIYNNVKEDSSEEVLADALIELNNIKE